MIWEHNMQTLSYFSLKFFPLSHECWRNQTTGYFVKGVSFPTVLCDASKNKELKSRAAQRMKGHFSQSGISTWNQEKWGGRGEDGREGNTCDHTLEPWGNFLYPGLIDGSTGSWQGFRVNRRRIMVRKWRVIRLPGVLSHQRISAVHWNSICPQTRHKMFRLLASTVFHSM